MDIIHDLFFSVQNRDPLDLLLQFLALAAVAFLVIWLCQLIWFRVLRKSHPGEPVDIIYQLAMLRSLVTYLFLVAVLFFFMIRINGLHTFRWSDPGFYLALLPFLLIFLIPVLLYFVRYSRLMKLIK